MLLGSTEHPPRTFLDPVCVVVSVGAQIVVVSVGSLSIVVSVGAQSVIVSVGSLSLVVSAGSLSLVVSADSLCVVVSVGSLREVVSAGSLSLVVSAGPLIRALSLAQLQCFLFHPKITTLGSLKINIPLIKYILIEDIIYFVFILFKLSITTSPTLPLP